MNNALVRRKYYWEYGYHAFDDKDNYLGWFSPDGVKAVAGSPFADWVQWDIDKHKYLTDELGFEYEGPNVAE